MNSIESFLFLFFNFFFKIPKGYTMYIYNEKYHLTNESIIIKMNSWQQNSYKETDRQSETHRQRRTISIFNYDYMYIHKWSVKTGWSLNRHA